jgi:hypothetical protein
MGDGCIDFMVGEPLGDGCPLLACFISTKIGFGETPGLLPWLFPPELPKGLSAAMGLFPEAFVGIAADLEAMGAFEVGELTPLLLVGCEVAGREELEALRGVMLSRSAFTSDGSGT